MDRYTELELKIGGDSLGDNSSEETYVLMDGINISQAIQRLGTWETIIEKGNVVPSEYKVGDIIYFIHKNSVVLDGVIEDIYIAYNKTDELYTFNFKVRNDLYNIQRYVSAKDVNTTWYSTQEDAELILKHMIPLELNKNYVSLVAGNTTGEVVEISNAFYDVTSESTSEYITVNVDYVYSEITDNSVYNSISGIRYYSLSNSSYTDITNNLVDGDELRGYYLKTADSITIKALVGATGTHTITISDNVPYATKTASITIDVQTMTLDRDYVSVVIGGNSSEEIVVSNYNGDISCISSNDYLIVNIINNVLTVNAIDGSTPGSNIIIIEDSSGQRASLLVDIIDESI